MGTPPVPTRAFWELCAADDAYDEFVGQAKQLGVMSGGHHNRNYVLPLTEAMGRRVGREPGTNVIVRIRRPEALPVVIRTWEHEMEVLAAIGRVLPEVPKCLAQRSDSAVHSYVEGVPLSKVCANGKPVDSMVIGALAGLFAQMSQVRREALPPLPEGWPSNDKDSQAFLRTLAHLADRQIRQPNWSAFGGLFAALGIPEDALPRLAERVPSMARRPYSLLHTDLHRDNVIVTHRGDPPLISVDWELATYGDPLHDLATHLVRMQYPEFQWGEVIEAWYAAIQVTRPMAANGLARDLPHYVAFERAQSVYPDVMRAARSLEHSLDQQSLDQATASVSRALSAAAEPLRLTRVPDEAEVERVLLRWQASRHDRRPGGRRAATALGWKPNERVPEHPDFPRSAVVDALIAEGTASAGRVFKGTAHLNSVVRVPGIGLSGHGAAQGGVGLSS
ncbi:aminoglycoside phosphotransferase family protein [Streptomyces sp. GLT-R25]